MTRIKFIFAIWVYVKQFTTLYWIYYLVYLSLQTRTWFRHSVWLPQRPESDIRTATCFLQNTLPCFETHTRPQWVILFQPRLEKTIKLLKTTPNGVSFQTAYNHLSINPPLSSHVNCKLTKLNVDIQLIGLTDPCYIRLCEQTDHQTG